MTVPSQTSRDSQSGNGVTLAFTVPFRILEQTHIRVLLTVAGVTTEQVLTTNYTVSNVGEASTTVTFLVAPPNSSTITFLRNVPFTQETDYVPNDPFPAESHERALDKLTMEVQQLNEIGGENGRTIKIPAETTGVSTTLPTPVALGLWGWNETASAPRYFTPTEIGTTLAFSNFIADEFLAGAGQTNFTLTADPGNLANLDVSIDGVTQVPGTDYTYAGTTLSFAAAMAGGEIVLARYGTALPTGITDASAVNYTPPSTGVAGSVRSFLDSLWTAGASAGAALIRFLQAGTGAVARTAQDKMRESVSVKDFGAVGDGVTDDSAAVGLAQAASDSILFPAGAYLFGSNVTLTADMIVPSGVTLKPANGVTVTVESNIEAGDYTIFDLSAAGLISLTKRARVARLAWFGLSPDATAAANTTAFNSAIDACPASDGIELLFPAGTIQSNGFTVDKSGVTVTGHNAGTWLVNSTTNAPCIEVAVAAGKASWCHLRNLRIGQNASVAPVAGNCGVRLLRTDQTTLDDIVCFDFPDNLREGFLFEDADNTTVRNLKAINCTSHGFRWTNAAGGCTDTFGNALLAYGNTGSGFRFEGCSGFYANNLHAYNNNHAFEWPTGFTNQFFFVSSWIGDTSASYNWLIQNLNRSAFAACWAATQQSAAVNTFATGVFISSANAYDITFDGLTAHNNNSHGVQITSSALDITINGGRSTANGVGGSGSGYRVELATDITIQGARAKGNATNGLVTTAVASDYLMFQNNNLRGNTGASLNNNSTGLNNQVGTNIV